MWSGFAQTADPRRPICLKGRAKRMICVSADNRRASMALVRARRPNWCRSRSGDVVEAGRTSGCVLRPGGRLPWVTVDGVSFWELWWAKRKMSEGTLLRPVRKQPYQNDLGAFCRQSLLLGAMQEFSWRGCCTLLALLELG